MYLLLVAIRLQMSDLIPNYPQWGNWAFLELHCLHFQAPQLFCPGWIPLSLEKELRFCVYPLFHFYFVLKRIICLMKLKAFLITETRSYFPLLPFSITCEPWTLKASLQNLLHLSHVSIWRNEPWNTETHKTDQNRPITNHKPWPFFLGGPLKWLTAAKNANIRWLLNFAVWVLVKSTVKCMLNETLRSSE